jgi:FkbM family methyltransferase
MVKKRIREIYSLMGFRGLVAFSLYKMLYPTLQNFKSTLQLIEWSRKSKPVVKKDGGYLMLGDLPSFPQAKFYFRPYSSDSLVVKQHFFSTELKPVIEFFQSISYVPSLMVDAGGNIGAAARFIQLHFPKIKTIVIEPSEENCRLIKMNCKEADYKLFPNALWYQAEKLSLDMTNEAWGIRVSSFSGKGKSVEAMTLQTILNQAAWGVPDFLKIDIEGSEEKIFEKDGDLKQILTNVRCVSIEPHSEKGSLLIRNVLYECGFKIAHHGELIYGFRYS